MALALLDIPPQRLRESRNLESLDVYLGHEIDEWQDQTLNDLLKQAVQTRAWEEGEARTKIHLGFELKRRRGSWWHGEREIIWTSKHEDGMRAQQLPRRPGFNF